MTSVLQCTLFQCLITKRLLSQKYGLSSGHLHHQLSADQLARKITLCQELLAVIGKIDRGLSQFRGLTLFELFSAKQTLCMRKAGCDSPAGLGQEDKKCLKQLLTVCYKCLHIERDNSHPKYVALLALEALRIINKK